MNYKDLLEEAETNREIAELELKKHERVGPKRLILDIPENWHAEVKKRATSKNISIKAWVSRAIIKMIEEEKKYE